MWLVLLLSSGFSRLRPWLCSLEFALRHIHLLDDKGIVHPMQGIQRHSYWGLLHSGLQCNDWCSHHMQNIVITFLATDTMAFLAAIGKLYTNSSSYSIAYPVPLPITL